MGCGPSLQWKPHKQLSCIDARQSTLSQEEQNEIDSAISKWSSGYLVQNADSWHFNIFDYTSQLKRGFLGNLAGYILVKTKLIENLKLDKFKLHYFFQDLEKTYNEEVPYHNAIHATDVLQGVYFSLQRDKEGEHLIDRLSPEESFALLIAAAGHDAGHLGKSNQFLRQCDHHFAQVDQDSPNEAMHFRVLHERIVKWKILHHLPRESYKQIISLIKELVLATNMEKHPKITEEWREISKEFSFESQKCRVAFMKCVLKFSDISNPARPKELYEEWTKRLSLEQRAENDERLRLGLDDQSLRRKSLPQALAKLQCWFIEKRVIVYLKNIKQIGFTFTEPEAQVNLNLKSWKKIDVC